MGLRLVKLTIKRETEEKELNKSKNYKWLFVL